MGRDSDGPSGARVRVVCQAPGCGRVSWRWPSYVRGRVFCDPACAGAALRAEWAAGSRRVSPLAPGPRPGASRGCRAGRAVPAVSRPRLAARADARRWAAYVAGWGDTPTPAEARWCVLRVFAACAPGAGRAPTTAG